MDTMETLKSWVDESKKIVFFGGAGVSTESGIPDFRSVDGLYHQKFDYPPEKILSGSFFWGKPEYFYKFYREKMLPLEAEPNAAHAKLAQWEREGKLLAVVTQNIDGLHQKAGSGSVYELHGSVHRNYCTKCRKFFGPEYIRDHTPLPLCDSCGALIKPDVVLYEESLNDKCINGAVNAISQADLGALYLAGLGVEQDYEEARRLLRLAAEQGDSMGQFFLGWMYENGWGVEQSLEEALKWYRLAAGQGLEQAAEALARLEGQ